MKKALTFQKQSERLVSLIGLKLNFALENLRRKSPEGVTPRVGHQTLRGKKSNLRKVGASPDFFTSLSMRIFDIVFLHQSTFIFNYFFDSQI